MNRFIRDSSYYLALVMGISASNANAVADHAELLFVRRIQPLLSEKCLACHGNDASEIQGGLDMRSRASLLRSGNQEKPVLVAGKPDESPIYQAILRTHNDWEPMPP